MFNLPLGTSEKLRSRLATRGCLPDPLRPRTDRCYPIPDDLTNSPALRRADRLPLTALVFYTDAGPGRNHR